MPELSDVIAALIAWICGIAVGIVGYATRPTARRERRCWHHDDRTGESWVGSYLIDLGRRKLFRCAKCRRAIIV